MSFVKSVLVSLFFISISFSSVAQVEPTVSVKLENKTPAFEPNHLRNFPIISLGSNFYEVRFDKEQSKLIEYSKSNGTPKVIDLSIAKSGLGSETFFADLLKVKEKVYAVLRKNIDDPKAKYYLQEFDLDDFELVGAPVFVLESSAYKMRWWNGVYTIGYPEMVLSANKENLLVIDEYKNGEKNVNVKMVHFNSSLEKQYEYNLSTSKTSKQVYFSYNITDAGRVLARESDSDYWKAFSEGEKELPAPENVLHVLYQGEKTEIPLIDDNGSSIALAVDQIENEKIYSGSTFNYFKPKKSKDAKKSGVQLTVIDLKQNRDNCIVSNDNYPLVFNDLNKFMEKEQREDHAKYYQKEGSYRMSYNDYGTYQSNGIVYLVIRRSEYFNSSYDSDQAVTVMKFDKAGVPPEVSFLPFNSTMNDMDWFVKNGKPYFVSLQEGTNVDKNFDYSKSPKRLANFTKNIGFCIMEPGFGEEKGYSINEFDSSVSFGKSKPNMSKITYSSEYDSFIVFCYKESGTGYSEEQYRIYSIDYLD